MAIFLRSKVTFPLNGLHRRSRCMEACSAAPHQIPMFFRQQSISTACNITSTILGSTRRPFPTIAQTRCEVATRRTPAVCRATNGCESSGGQPEVPTPVVMMSSFALCFALLAYSSPAVAEEVQQAVESASASGGALYQGGWLGPLVDGLQSVLVTIQTGLDYLHVPYSYGWSIVCLTLCVKIVTFPFTKQQVQSAMAVQKLKPQIDQIKMRYGDDDVAVKRETSALYTKAEVNPLAGCLPALATLPIFFALYRTLSNVTNEGLLTEGFYWIPTLAGPTSLAAQKAGAGTAWLLPLVDGAPPIGWDDASKYLILPVLLVASQFASNSILSPIDPNDDNANTQRALLTFFPLMIGWFSLNVPSGLSLYYFANTVLTSLVQIYLKKLGGVQLDEFDLGPLDLGKGRRMGPTVNSSELMKFDAVAKMTDEQATFADIQQQAEKSQAELADRMAHVTDGDGTQQAAESMVAMSSGNGVQQGTSEGSKVISKRCKRKKRQTGTQDSEQQVVALS